MQYGIGLMSGTSLDGIDVALVSIDNNFCEGTYTLVDFMTVPFEERIIKQIKQAIDVTTSNVLLICSLNMELGKIFGQAVNMMKDKHQLSGADIWFVASHGQTIYHHPINQGEYVSSTLQIGESSVICEVTETTVVSDFRYRDMAVGGQGAPIVPFSEYVLYKSQDKQRILQNIGGISNATVIPANGSMDEVVAFDTGPGNMIIDEFVRRFYQKEYDDKGHYASLGKVDELVLNDMLNHPFMKKSFPKSTGREDFGEQYVDELLSTHNLNSNDWIATATAFTAKAIRKSLDSYVSGDSQTEFIVGGGGSYNPVLIEMIRKEMPKSVTVMIQEEIGLSSDAKEAIAMVVLGHMTMEHKPSNVPSATGANKPVILGKITNY